MHPDGKLPYASDDRHPDIDACLDSVSRCAVIFRERAAKKKPRVPIILLTPRKRSQPPTRHFRDATKTPLASHYYYSLSLPVDTPPPKPYHEAMKRRRHSL